MLRKAAVFVRQSFADAISKANMCEMTEEAKVARNLIPIDVMQAKGLRKNTGGKLYRLEDAVYMYVERQAFQMQGLLNDVQEIDNMISRGLLQKDKVAKFWSNLSDLIIERVSRNPVKVRPFVKQEDILLYA